MGIKGDLDEAKQLWKNSSWMMRLFVLLSVFVTTSSIASLSDIVFKWKGFILDGIQFYREYIAQPVAGFFDVLGLNYSLVDVNVFMLVSLYAGSYFRAMGLQQLWNDLKEKPISDTLTYLAFGSFYLFAGTPDSDSFSYSILIIYTIALGYSFYYVLKHWHDDKETSIKFIAVPVLSVSGVLVLGAINTGLTM